MLFQHAVAGAADPDAEERDGQNEAEGEDGAAENRSQHSIPNELHGEECKADDRRRHEHEASGNGFFRSFIDGASLDGKIGRAGASYRCSAEGDDEIHTAGPEERAPRSLGFEEPEVCEETTEDGAE